MLENIQQLKRIDYYPDTLRKESELDNNFAKAIKAKLALAKID